MVLGAPGAPQTPEIDDFQPAENSCIKNPGVDLKQHCLFRWGEWQQCRRKEDDNDYEYTGLDLLADFRFQFRCLRIGLPSYFSLIYVTF